MAESLSPRMTLREFENGYWYLDQLKDFAGRIGIPSAKKLRKDELEKAIVAFLRTGTARLPTKRSLRRTGPKDVERGLHLKLRIENSLTSSKPIRGRPVRTQSPRGKRSRSSTSRRATLLEQSARETPGKAQVDTGGA
jgi:hypothetical protein